MKIIRPSKITDSGGSFTRSTTATYFDRTGTLQTASINTPRVTFTYSVPNSTWILFGVLIERESTNLLLNSSTPATQSLTMTTQQYSLQFYGTGTVSVTGAHTASVVGTHANVKTTYTFTPSAGSVTFTPSGTVQYWQVETGEQTSYIPTAGTAITRAQDIVTGSGFIYSNIPETDYPAWVSGTTYSIGDKVIRTTATTHSIYERLQNGAGTTAPESDEINWIRVAPTNRWAVFDDSPSTLSSNSQYVTYIFKPGRINSIALLELDATEVSVNLYASTSVGQPPIEQYHGYNDLLNNSNVGNWYEYFYEPFYYQTSLAITNMVNASLLDLPQYSDTIMCITVAKGTDIASLGIIASGISYTLGNTQAGMSLGIIDYSKKDTDDFGNTILVRRKYSKRFKSTFFLLSSKVDTVSNLLSQYRATPVVWIGTDSAYSQLVIYGFYRDWNIDIPNNIGSFCSIDIEGLT